MTDNGNEFDSWLSATLAADSGRVVRQTVPAPHYGHGPRWRRRWAWGLPAVLGTKLLTGVTVVALAGAAVGAKTAVTGSANPLQWAPPPAVPALTCALAHTCGSSPPGIVARPSARPSHPAHPATPQGHPTPPAGVSPGPVGHGRSQGQSHAHGRGNFVY